MLMYIKMKKSTAELDHNGHLKIYVDPKKNYGGPDILSPFLQNG